VLRAFTVLKSNNTAKHGIAVHRGNVHRGKARELRCKAVFCVSSLSGTFSTEFLRTDQTKLFSHN
jgi:hypothetical protein